MTAPKRPRKGGGEDDAARAREIEAAARRTEEARARMDEELRELRARADDREKEIEELRAEVERLGGQVSALVEENRALSERAEGAEREAEPLREVAAAAQERIRAASEERDAAIKRAQSAEEVRDTLTKDRDRLAKRLELAEGQLGEKGIEPVLPPEEVADLIGSLIGRLDRLGGGLAVRDGQIGLKLAVSGIGKDRGFVVPTADAPKALRDAAHDVSLRFDRGGIEQPGT